MMRKARKSLSLDGVRNGVAVYEYGSQSAPGDHRLVVDCPVRGFEFGN